AIVEPISRDHRTCQRGQPALALHGPAVELVQRNARDDAREVPRADAWRDRIGYDTARDEVRPDEDVVDVRLDPPHHKDAGVLGAVMDWRREGRGQRSE